MSQRLRAVGNILGGQSRLKAIRGRNQLDVAELRSLLMYEGNYENHILPFYEFIDSNKHIFTHHNLESQTRQDMRKDAAKMILAIMKHFQLDPVKQPSRIIYAFWAISMYDGGIVTKSMLHCFLYCKSLVMFGHNAKHEQLLAEAIALRDFGCFALTEFHHGSYSKEVQTLATYNHQAKEFVLTTQGQKGMKYWIGAASEIANMSTIWAQLIINGKSYGPHAFIVPLRCKKTHRVLPGITIGDCGPKNGLDYIDNGYIILDNVTIPKDNLLGKLGHVDESGNYVSMIKNTDARFGFHMSPLSGGRGAVSFISNVGALKAATVALRYACNRKQFQNTKKTDEVIIIDYALTKNRLIPDIAQIFVQISPGLDLAKRYFQNPNILSDLKYAAELHAISACTKARISWNCSSTAETTRTILGGHGYSAFNNFKSFFHDTDINNTWEGDSNMLLQQTSKFLMKIISSKQKTSILDLSFAWEKFELNEGKIQANLRSLESIDSLLKGLFVQKYINATTTFAELSKSHTDKAFVWLHFHPQAGNALALSYADYYIYSITRQRLSLSKSDKNKEFLLKCLFLWAFSLIERQRLGSLDLRKSLQKQILLLSDELTEPCVVATDILIPSSHIIGSVFGNFEGNIYDEYLNLIYSAKDAFTRVPYFQEIVEIKQKG